MAISLRKKRSSILAPGDRIGDYEIIEKTGQGGIAEIYRGRQASLDREVAIKLLLERNTDDSEIVSRFEREAKIIARLRHPNIVHVIDRGIDDRGYYFVMDFIEGNDFQHILLYGKYSFEQKIDVVINLLKALDYAHKNGVIHRDVKPSNILIDKQGYVLVVDFGIAQMFDDNESDYTETGLIMGTPAYMSPEQKVSSGKVNRTSDLYAVGVILYEIMTGKKPAGDFTPPSSMNPEISSRLDAIVLKCLEHYPKDRFQTAVELKDELLSAINDKLGAEKQEHPGANSSTSSLIGNCVFLDTIKETPFGATYLVENRVDNKLYVIKKLVNRTAGLREAKILAKLDHPNILKIHGAGGDAQKSVMVTQYAQGGSLADRLVKPYPVDEAMAIFRQIVSGISFAHNNNVIHGNLRPSNILFDNKDRIKLSDFALPEHYSQDKKNWYAAPESKKAKASDIYSAGVILHQLLTNRLPAFDDQARLVLAPGSIEIPQDVESLMAAMVEKLRVRRIASFEEVLARIDKYEQGPKNESLGSGSGGFMGRVFRKMRQARYLIPILTMILIAVAAALVLGDIVSLDSLLRVISD